MSDPLSYISSKNRSFLVKNRKDNLSDLFKSKRIFTPLISPIILSLSEISIILCEINDVEFCKKNPKKVCDLLKIMQNSEELFLKCIDPKIIRIAYKFLESFEKLELSQNNTLLAIQFAAFLGNYLNLENDKYSIINFSMISILNKIIVCSVSIELTDYCCFALSNLLASLGKINKIILKKIEPDYFDGCVFKLLRSVQSIIQNNSENELKFDKNELNGIFHLFLGLKIFGFVSFNLTNSNNFEFKILFQACLIKLISASTLVDQTLLFILLKMIESNKNTPYIYVYIQFNVHLIILENIKNEDKIVAFLCLRILENVLSLKNEKTSVHLIESNPYLPK